MSLFRAALAGVGAFWSELIPTREPIGDPFAWEEGLAEAEAAEEVWEPLNPPSVRAAKLADARAEALAETLSADYEDQPWLDYVTPEKWGMAPGACPNAGRLCHCTGACFPKPKLDASALSSAPPPGAVAAPGAASPTATAVDGPEGVEASTPSGNPDRPTSQILRHASRVVGGAQLLRVAMCEGDDDTLPALIRELRDRAALFEAIED